MPGGGIAVGNKIGQQTFAALAFAASLATAQSITGSAAAEVVDLDTEDLDTDSWYTPAGASFQPDVAGVYLITGQLTMAAFSGVLTVTLYRGVVEVARVDAVRTAAAATVQISQLVPMNGSTDALTMKVEHTDPSSRSVTAASMAGILMGAL